VFFAQIFQENTFLKTKPNFPLTGKCFSLTNFSNGKQTQESLESSFPETTFRKTNTAKRKNIFLETKPNFYLLTNFSNDKQTQENLKNNFLKNKFQKTNMGLERFHFCFKLHDILHLLQSVFLIRTLPACHISLRKKQ
jgi:hypothetical protein